MKIDYTYTDAMNLLNSLISGRDANSSHCKTKKDAWEEGFLSALTCCGVKHVDLRIFAPDGNNFPQTQIDEYHRNNEEKSEPQMVTRYVSADVRSSCGVVLEFAGPVAVPSQDGVVYGTDIDKAILSLCSIGSKIERIKMVVD